MSIATTELEVPPAGAATLFGDRWELAQRYAQLLAADAVTRGLLGPGEPARLWSRHILNSLAVAELVPTGAVVIDLGSGAGLPGIPLALARPDVHVRLVEPLARRTSFLTEVVTALGIDVEVVRARAEMLDPHSVDVVVARAVAPLKRLIPLALPLLRHDGELLALKGSSVEAEIADARTVLASWPTARVSVHRRAAGPIQATVVRIGLDDRATDSRGSSR